MNIKNDIIISKRNREIIKSDIVFSLDISKSMQPVIMGLKANIMDFIDNIKKDIYQADIDIRLAIVANRWLNKELIEIYCYDFTNNHESLKNALTKLSAFGDEASLPAIDYALDMNWRIDAHKFIIHFTNETIEKGWNPEISIQMIPNLIKKIEDYKIALIIIGKSCESFMILGQQDRCSFHPIKSNQDFTPDNFRDIMQKMSKKVATESKEVVDGQIKKTMEDLFKIRGQQEFRLININQI